MSLDLHLSADLARHSRELAPLDCGVNGNVGSNLLRVRDLVASNVPGVILGNPALPVVIAMLFLVNMLNGASN